MMFRNMLVFLSLVAGSGLASGEAGEQQLKSEWITTEDGSTAVKLVPENFSKQKTVIVLVERLSTSNEVIRDLMINDANEVVFAKDSEKMVLFPVDHFVPGEPLKVDMIRSDGVEKGSTRIFPRPLEVTDGNGRSFRLELSSADGSAFKFVGEGFSPKESLVLRCTTGKKKLTTKLSPTKEGRFSGTLRPTDRGKKSGTSVVEVSSKKGSLRLTFDWGQAASVQ